MEGHGGDEDPRKSNPASSGLILGLEAPLPTPSGFQRVVLLLGGIPGTPRAPPPQTPGIGDPTSQGAESQHWDLKGRVTPLPQLVPDPPNPSENHGEYKKNQTRSCSLFLTHFQGLG